MHSQSFQMYVTETKISIATLYAGEYIDDTQDYVNTGTIPFFLFISPSCLLFLSAKWQEMSFLLQLHSRTALCIHHRRFTCSCGWLSRTVWPVQNYASILHCMKNCYFSEIADGLTVDLCVDLDNHRNQLIRVWLTNHRTLLTALIPLFACALITLADIKIISSLKQISRSQTILYQTS